MEIVKIPIEQLTPDPHNAKDHPAEQIEQIKASIQEFGNLDPIGVWGDDNIIVEGHGRYIALQQLGYTEADCIRLDQLTDEERRAYALVHNKTTMNSGFIDEMLNLNLDQITDIDMTLFGFDAENPKELEAINDEFNEDTVEDTHQVKVGDIWQLGDHRLMCGDSTSETDVMELTEGKETDLVVTDPPYNVNYNGDNDKATIMNDNMKDAEFFDFLKAFYINMLRSLKPGGAFYIFHADSEGYNFRAALKAAGGSTRETLIWVVLGRQDYQWKHEPCLYGWKDGAAHYFTNDRTQTTVIEDQLDFDKLKKEEAIDLLKQIYSDAVPTTVIKMNKPTANDLHPTMKPVELMGKLIRNSSRENETVLDLFGGSGSTLIACEQLNRKCKMMEFDPHYADVIITRWEQFTGKTAERIRQR